MSDPRHLLGRAAEDAVAGWLERHGWRIVARRQRSRHGGEVDLIALDTGEVLVGIEVRARRSRRTGTPAASVNDRRVRRVARTLAAIAGRGDVPHRGLRIDLVTVEPYSTEGRWRLRRVAGIG